MLLMLCRIKAVSTFCKSQLCWIAWWGSILIGMLIALCCCRFWQANWRIICEEVGSLIPRLMWAWDEAGKLDALAAVSLAAACCLVLFPRQVSPYVGKVHLVIHLSHFSSGVLECWSIEYLFRGMKLFEILWIKWNRLVPTFFFLLGWNVKFAHARLYMLLLFCQPGNILYMLFFCLFCCLTGMLLWVSAIIISRSSLWLCRNAKEQSSHLHRWWLCYMFPCVSLACKTRNIH